MYVEISVFEISRVDYNIKSEVTLLLIASQTDE